jgi:hypothetical protein
MTTEQHIAKIQTKLQEIAYGGANIIVSPYYISSADKYPFFFITDGEINDTLIDSQTYQRISDYEINVIFEVEPNDIAGLQTKIRAISQLIIGKLGNRATRDDGDPNWLDINFRKASAPINGVEIGLSNNVLVRTFTVQVEELVSF